MRITCHKENNWNFKNTFRRKVRKITRVTNVRKLMLKQQNVCLFENVFQ